MPVFRLFGVFFRVAVDPPVVPPPPPGMGFRLQVFWGDSAKTPHLSTLITTKITFPCNLLEITGADFLYMEIARLYPHPPRAAWRPSLAPPPASQCTGQSPKTHAQLSKNEQK